MRDQQAMPFGEELPDEACEADGEEGGEAGGEESGGRSTSRVRWSAWSGTAGTAWYCIVGTSPEGVAGLRYALTKTRRLPAGSPAPLGAVACPVAPWNTLEMEQMGPDGTCRACGTGRYQEHKEDCAEWLKVAQAAERWVDMRFELGDFESVQRAKDAAERDAAEDEAPQGRLF